MFGRHARARHDGRRRGQPQGTRTSNDQHGHSMNQRQLDAVAAPPPCQQGQQGQHQHHRHKHGGDLIHQPLNGRLGRLRVFHQADDVGQDGSGSGSRDLDDQAPFTVDAAPGHSGANPLGHRQRLACEHGFVQLGVPFKHQAIGGDALTRQHHHTVAHQQLVDRNVLFAIGPNHARTFRAQGMQGTNGVGGLTFGARLQPFAQEHQRDDHRRALEIQMHHAALRSRPPQPHRQGPTGCGAQRHQHVHVAGARQQGVPARFVKTRAQHELHRRGQQKLPQRRQHPVLARHIAHHRQHQRQAQHQASEHRRKTKPRPRSLLFEMLRRQRLVACITHRAAQTGFMTGIVVVPGHTGRLAGQVNTHRRDPWQLGNGPLHTGHTRGAGHAANADVAGAVTHKR